jgi:transposase
VPGTAAWQTAGQRKRGHSKNGRDDAPQIVVGLAVSRDGLPVRHWVFPGNTVDVTTVEQIKQDLRGWKLGRCVFVGDAGMVSEANLRTLALGGGKYIVCMPLRLGSEAAEQVIRRPGRYQSIASNLRGGGAPAQAPSPSADRAGGGARGTRRSRSWSRV